MSNGSSPKFQPRTIPMNGLDFEMLTTDPVWGKDVTEELYQKLIEEGAQGEELKQSLWGLLSFYTRDLRLGNLDPYQLIYCNYYLDMAGDCLDLNCKKSFIISLKRAISTIELSQSKGGFLRKIVNTLTHQTFREPQQENNNKKLLAGKKK